MNTHWICFMKPIEERVIEGGESLNATPAATGSGCVIATAAAMATTRL